MGDLHSPSSEESSDQEKNYSASRPQELLARGLSVWASASSRQKTVWLALSHLLVAGIITLITFFGALRTTPDLVGLSQSKAEQILNSNGLEPIASEGEARPFLPSSLKVVVSQEQTPGDTVKRGDRIRFSVEPQTTKMPDLVGLSWEEFSNGNEASHFDASLEGIKTVPKPLFLIDAQSPVPGESISYGDPIHLVLSIPTVEMPDLVGMEREQASRTLEALNLTGKPKAHFAAEVVVRSQAVKPGTFVDVYSDIELEGGIILPDLIGLSPLDAGDLLQSNSISNRSHEGSIHIPITTQNPAPGTIIQFEERVTYASAKHTTTYRVESNGSNGSVTWGLKSISQETDATFPWESTSESEEAPSRSINLVAQTYDGTEITCKLIVDGEVVLENTSTGPYAAVTCYR